MSSISGVNSAERNQPLPKALKKVDQLAQPPNTEPGKR
jgi:hypothetical protein